MAIKQVVTVVNRFFYIRDAVDAGGEQGRSAQEDNHLSLRGEQEWRILVSYEPAFCEDGRTADLVNVL